jgi:hypothetical protein
MLKNKKRTKGRKYNRGKLWIERRDEAFRRAGNRCEVSGAEIGHWGVPDYGAKEIPWVWKRAADHIIPERWIRQFMRGADPHLLENLIVITPKLHGQKWAVERRIYAGDWLAYIYELKKLGFEEARVKKALAALAKSIPEALCKPTPCRNTSV